MKKMEINEKYKHIGYSYPGVPKGWKPVVEKAMKDKDAERRIAMQSMAPAGVIGAAGAAMKKGGLTASRRADGIAQRGKTKGRFV